MFYSNVCSFLLLLSSSVWGIPKHQYAEYDIAVQNVNFEAVKQDIQVLLTDSKPEWPADYGNYGPFFIRLAWHCSGSYRTSDGRGGCDGGRQRFDPERSWADNTNLDKARSLLWPIKEKYGLGLSWGDLIILTGTTAIESMGGPWLGFCGGRVDDDNGLDSIELGPSPEQERLAPCPVQGECKEPLGAAVVGLIYVDPEGYQGKPIPHRSAVSVRDTFGRMAMNDSETVALIGGGHAFGKAHGACPEGVGPAPSEDPVCPWKGKCGVGKGVDTFTSGIEGSWTTNPIKWDNEYFKLLKDYDWIEKRGAGGKHQWHVNVSESKGKCPFAPKVDGSGFVPTMMMTSDMSLKNDPENQYQSLVDLFANDQIALDNAFKHAWYKLVTRDMGPVERCRGPFVPPAQPFQYPLPPPSPLASELDWDKVREDILKLSSLGNYNAKFMKLAFQCASTYRRTDHLGGCNGARIRFSPEKDWSENVLMDEALISLKVVKQKYGEALSWADLIVFAGTVVVENTSSQKLLFCPGRSDSLSGEGSTYLKASYNYNDHVTEFREKAKLLGLTERELLALNGQLRSADVQTAAGFSGTWVSDPDQFSNEFFKLLLNVNWEKHTSSSNVDEYKAPGMEMYMTKSDIALKYDASLLAIAQDFASDNDMFLKEFSQAWTKLMNIDRFDGPAENMCKQHDVKVIYFGLFNSNIVGISLIVCMVILGLFFVTLIVVGCRFLCIRRKTDLKLQEQQPLLIAHLHKTTEF